MISVTFVMFDRSMIGPFSNDKFSETEDSGSKKTKRFVF